MQIIETSDLASYLRNPSDLDQAAAVQIVGLANGIVTEQTGELAAPISARVTAITLEVAARAYRNPDGYASETIDDYTYRRDANTRQAGVYLTPAEKAELRGYAADPTSSARSVRLVAYPEDNTTSTLPTP